MKSLLSGDGGSMALTGSIASRLLAAEMGCNGCDVGHGGWFLMHLHLFNMFLLMGRLPLSSALSQKEEHNKAHNDDHYWRDTSSSVHSGPVRAIVCLAL